MKKKKKPTRKTLVNKKIVKIRKTKTVKRRRKPKPKEDRFSARAVLRMAIDKVQEFDGGGFDYRSKVALAVGTGITTREAYILYEVLFLMRGAGKSIMDGIMEVVTHPPQVEITDDHQTHPYQTYGSSSKSF